MAQINQLEQAIGTLADAVQGLTMWLEPVSRADAPITGDFGRVPLPAPEERKAEVDVEVCQLATTLRSFRHRVNNIRKAVEGQVGRLEI